ncbi:MULTISPECIES: hypothetical protein [Cryobacterium]|uniref:Uncharacterized protein n=1 Tax=Cryobacterium breve TaxID=1259258 RepID=A0ABY2J4F7_9MICO|nr:MULTISPECIES: hypothetical protein [Cryobacterium]TFC92044.1 hypothetical protein E3T20_12065 [Cryobacterium sp. TmT3-12]TFC99817.1 hypothetical protein E3O65_05440 [Cryobacterium breve]
MAQRVYATAINYAAVAEDPFEGDAGKLGKRLRSASIEVEKLTRLAVYTTDVDGYPTDADVSDAFTEATCAIVEHWEITDDPTGAESQQGAVKIGSVSLGTTSSSAANESVLEKLTKRIGEKAVDILTNAGIRSSLINHR